MFYSWANCDNSEVELNEQVCPSSIIIHNHTGFPPFLSRTSLSFLDTHSWHPKPKRQKSLCIMLNFYNKLQYKFVPLLQLFFRRLQIGKQKRRYSYTPRLGQVPCSTSVVLATLHEDHVGSGLNSTRKIVLLFICGKASKLLHIFINIHD